MDISRKLVIIALVFVLFISAGFVLYSKEDSKYSSFPNAEYSVEAEVLGASTVRFRNNSNKTIYEFSISGDNLLSTTGENVNCVDADRFDVCLLKDTLVPGEEYQISLDSSAAGKINYFAKDAFDSIVIAKSL